MTRDTNTRSGLYRRAGVFAVAIVAAALVFSACAQRKQFTWANRLPDADCNPRTARAKAELRGCPKLADPQHPTLQEEQEFVTYMNKKDAIEGTDMGGVIVPPGCYRWSIDQGQVNSKKVTNDPRCQGSDLEKKLRSFKLPSGG
jgi:hypothetical protein